MTNNCTKVTVRKRPIKNGQVSLYLDNYLRHSNHQITCLRTALKNPIHQYSSHHRPLIPRVANKMIS